MAVFLGFLDDGRTPTRYRRSTPRQLLRGRRISGHKIVCFAGCSVTWLARVSGKDGAERLENKQREQRRHPPHRRDGWDPDKPSGVRFQLSGH